MLASEEEERHLWPTDLSRDGRYLIFGRGQSITRTDGRELFYVTDDDMLVAVKVDADGDRFRPGMKEPL